MICNRAYHLSDSLSVKIKDFFLQGFRWFFYQEFTLLFCLLRLQLPAIRSSYLLSVKIQDFFLLFEFTVLVLWDTFSVRVV